MENNLYIQKLNYQNIGFTSSVVFDNVIFNEGTITYNQVSGNITFNQVGKYHINWWIATGNNNINSSFIISSSTGSSTYGVSPIISQSFNGMAIVDVLSVPTSISLINMSGGDIALAQNVPVKAMLSVYMQTIGSGSYHDLYDFQINQLTHILSQIIDLYPDNVLSVFVRGLYYMIGTPTSLFSSSYGTGLFILTDSGQPQVIPLNMITGVYLGDGSTYNESLTYLELPETLPDGWATKVITSVYDYLPVGTLASIYFSIGNSREGYIYKNELGMIVITADETGSQPTFIPATEASIILPTVTTSKKVNPTLKKIEIK
jgi:hypothetical protein